MPGSDQPQPAAAVREKYFALVDKAQFEKELPTLLDPGFISLERCAIEFGLQRQAELLQYNCLAVIWETLRRLGLAITRSDGGTDLNLEPLIN